MEESEHKAWPPLLLERKTHLMSGVSCKDQSYRYMKLKPIIIGANPRMYD